jgi:hypothetical protein
MRVLSRNVKINENVLGPSSLLKSLAGTGGTDYLSIYGVEISSPGNIIPELTNF